MPNQKLLLVAEDEPLVLLCAQDALEAAGFTVLTADSGGAALEVVESRCAELAGLITDIRLGSGPNGWDVAVRARELKPDISIIYASADSVHERFCRGVPKSVAVKKPYGSAQLATAISTLLTEGDSGNA